MTPEEAKKKLEEYKKKKANIINLCDLDDIPPMHSILIEEVNLNPNPENKDVYNFQRQGLILHYTALLKLAVAAGIEWDTNHIGITSHTENYTSAQAVGFIRGVYGKKIAFRGEDDIDLIALKEDLNDFYLASANTNNKNQDWINYCVNRDFRAKRKNRVKSTTSGARSRVIKALLKLKNIYTPEEIKNPFIIIRVILAPNLNDPAIQKLIIDHTFNPGNIYGSDIPLQISTSPQTSNDYDIIDIPKTYEPIQEPPTATEVFESLDLTAQVETLKNMAKQKKYLYTKFKESDIDNFDIKKRIDFFNHLKSIDEK